MDFLLQHIWEALGLALVVVVRRPAISLMVGMYFWAYTKMGSTYFVVGAVYPKFMRKGSEYNFGPCEIAGKDFFHVYMRDKDGEEFPIKKREFQFDFDKTRKQ